MRRRIAALLSIALVAGAFTVLTPAQPAHAFSFCGGVGTCAATGVFLGYCGLSSGSGTTGDGELFAWIGVGGTLILTGHLNGIVNAFPDVLNGESCISGADRFLISGLVVLLNCPDDLGPLGDLDTDRLLPSLPVLGDLHIWTNQPCVPNLLDLA